MDPDETWKLITSVDTDPDQRRMGAVNLLVWFAKQDRGARDEANPRVETCQAIIFAEFDALDRMMGK